MTIQECYKAIGGNYEDVLRRLPNEVEEGVCYDHCILLAKLC